MSAPRPWPAPVAERLTEGAFLLIDKPRGPSSHQVTAWVRDLLRQERAGHAGTLDPNVSGLLWVGVGPALRLVPLVLEFPKRYVGLVAFHAPVSAEALARVLLEFEAPVFQTPPVRSAVKRERRIRTIHHLTCLESDRHRALLDVTADSGTYVRTLAVDLGDALGVGGHLEELRRVGTGPFLESASVPMTAVADAVAAADAGDAAPLQALLHPMREVWGEFPVVRLRLSAASAVAHGADVARGGIEGVSRRFGPGAAVALVDPDERLVAIGSALVGSEELHGHRSGWVIDAGRVLADPARYPPRWRTPTEPAR